MRLKQTHENNQIHAVFAGEGVPDNQISIVCGTGVKKTAYAMASSSTYQFPVFFAELPSGLPSFSWSGDQAMKAFWAILLLWLLSGGGLLHAQNPLEGDQGFQIISEGNFTFNGGSHVHGPMAVGGNFIINTSAAAEINMDPVGTYVFPGDGSTTTGLMVKGSVTWTNGFAKVLSNRLIHIGNSSGSTQSDNGVNMNTQVLPAGTSYNNAKRIEGTVDQTPSPAVFQTVAFDFASLFNDFRANSDAMAACSNNVQLYNSSNVAISGNNVTSAQNVRINTLSNGTNYLDLTTTSLNNITELNFQSGGIPSASKLLVITVPLTANFTWNNSNLPGISNTSAPYILWNFTGSSTYTLNVNTASLVVGTIFAPNHNLTKSGTGDIDGNLIAKSITIGTGEIHFFPFGSSVSMCSTCSNVTSSGSIGSNQSGCAPFDPATLTETGAPSGGSGALEYQWQSSTNNSTWTDISGATAQTYNPPSLSATTYYRRGVRRNGCTAYLYSGSVAITVIATSSISSQPADGAICTGGTYSLSVTASGSPTYQWQSSTNNSTFTNISGATASSYTTPVLTSTTYYRVLVSSGTCTTTSGTATVTVVTDPSISVQPTGFTVCVNAAQSLSIVATGGTPVLTYQWQSSPNNSTWTNISGANAASHTPLSTATGTTYYRVVVSAAGNGCGSATSNSATVIVQDCVEICNNGIDDDGDGLIDAADPDCCLNAAIDAGQDQTICSGTSVSLNAKVTPASAGNCSGTVITAFPYAQGFESGLGYWTQSTTDDIDWTQNSGTTPSSGTGPNGAAEGTYYYFTESSSPNSPDKAAILTSPCFDLRTVGNAVFSFQYNMYGSNMGTLAVEATVDNGATWTSLWSESGDKGTPWLAGSVGLASLTGNIVKLRFVGTTGSGYRSDMAIDDLSLTVTPYTYAWSSGQTTSTISISPASTTTYTVTVSNAAGCSATDQVTITVNPCIEICGNNVDDDFDGLIDEGCAEICNNGIDDDGDGLIDCADPDCSNNLGGNITSSSGASICTGGSSTLTASGTGGNGTYTYAWSNGLGSGASKTVTPSTTTIYTVTITDGNGCTSTAQTTVTVVADPAIAAQPANGTICSGGTFALGVTATGGTPSLSYQWQSSTNNATWTNISGATSSTYTTPALTATTYYRVIVSATGNGCGSLTSNTSTVTVVADPSITTQPAGFTECEGAAQVLTVVATGGTPSLTYQWQSSLNNAAWTNISGATAASYTPPSASTGTIYYRAVVSAGGNGCGSVNSGSATVIVQHCAEICDNGLDDDLDGLVDCADPDCGGVPSPAIVADVATICNGGSASLTASATGGNNPYTFAWSNGLGSGANKTVSPSATTTYTVTVTSASGCTATSQMTINVNASPVANAGADVAICSGTSTNLSASVAGSNPPFIYAWSNGLGSGANKTVTPVATTTYTVTVTNNQGCTSTGQVTVTVNQTPVANAGPDVTVCKNFNTTLTATATGGTGPYTFNWSNGLGAGVSHVVNPSNTATYTVTVTSANGCISTDQVTVNVQICTEDCSNGLDDDGDGLTDCQDPDCGPVASAGSGVSICAGSSTTLIATATGGSGNLTYSWSNGLGNGATKTVTPAASTTYTVTVTSQSGCSSTAQVTVTVSICNEICNNGIDDDGDGLTDCEDTDCIEVAAPHLQDDAYTACPALPFTERVTYNDGNLQTPVFSIFTQPAQGMVTIDATGKFVYTPLTMECLVDSFDYQVCNQATGCCATATVVIILGDDTPPTLVNVPPDITLNCDDAIPVPPLVQGYDACPGISIEFDETSDQYLNGACEDFTITRTWQTTDLCGNYSVASQHIHVKDLTAPEMFRVYTLANGKKLVAGVAKRTSQDWKYIPFPVNFSQAPLVFSQVVSQNELSAVTVQQRNISSQGFELRLREEENADGTHAYEEVAWLAIEPGLVNDASGLAAGFLNNLNNNQQTLGYPQVYPAVPGFVATVQTAYEADPYTVRLSNPTASSIKVFLQEETSKDAELIHGNEKLGYLSFVQAASLADKDGRFIGESGQINLTNAWATVNLERVYTKPVVLLGGMSINDLEAVTIRVRNVTANSFEVRLQEWNYLDGSHSAEAASYLVVEGSIPAEVDYYCQGESTELQPGINLFAIDNCDNQVLFQTGEAEAWQNGKLVKTRNWTLLDDCGNSSQIIRHDSCDVAALKVKAILLGAMIGNPNAPLMRDDLRTQTLVPLHEPYSGLPAFSHVEDVTPGGGSGGGSNSGGTNTDKIVICHKAGTSAEHTILVPESALWSHLDHGDVVGTCSGGQGSLLTFDYRTVAAGNWNSAATWENGNVPAPDVISNKTISIEHDVSISNTVMTIKSNSQLFVTNCQFEMTSGNLVIENGAVVFTNAVFNAMAPVNVSVSGPQGRLVMVDGEAHIGQNLENNGGIFILENTCLEVAGNFLNTGGTDYLTGVCATIGQSFINHTNSHMQINDCKFRVKNSNLINEANGTLSGTGFVLWMETGTVSNDGTWISPLTQYCSPGVLPASVPVQGAQNCTGIADHFNPCTCGSGILVSTGGGGTVTGDTISGTGTGVLVPALLQVTGSHAIVDWMLVEIRNPGDASDILAYATVVLRRDGSIVTEGGDSVIVLSNLPEGDYYVTIRHRNHLGMMTDLPMFLTTNGVPLIDFTDPALPVRGGLGTGRMVNGKRMLWSGDLNEDSKVIYQGPYNDGWTLFSKVALDPGNTEMLANYILPGYELEDLNMDGKVIYQGPNNDRNLLLFQSVLMHPDNVALLANFIVLEKLP